MKQFVFKLLEDDGLIVEFVKAENYLSGLYQLMKDYDITCTEEQCIDFTFSGKPITEINRWLAAEGYDFHVLHCFEVSKVIF